MTDPENNTAPEGGPEISTATQLNELKNDVGMQDPHQAERTNQQYVGDFDEDVGGYTLDLDDDIQHLRQVQRGAQAAIKAIEADREDICDELKETYTDEQWGSGVYEGDSEQQLILTAAKEICEE